MKVYTNKEKQNKLRRLASLEGHDNIIDLLEDSIFDSLVPGICMNEECEENYNYEPDQDQGYCEVCETNTVMSCLRLNDMI
jgi:hypothetical protein